MTERRKSHDHAGRMVDVDSTRRSLAMTLLGAMGAGALLKGCAPIGNETDALEGDAGIDASSPSSVQQALSSTTDIYRVDTMVALRALTPAGGLASVAIVGGYYNVGDGGGGIFTWSTVAEKDDGKPGTALFSGTIVNPLVGGLINASPAAGWRRIYSGPLNVKWFGAKGDGVDDTGAVEAAYLAAVRLQTATVYFPRGYYGLVSTITIGDPINNTFTSINTLGEGAISTQILWKGVTSGAGLVATALRYWRNKYARMSGLTVSNQSGAKGTTIGTLLTGPASGTQSNGHVFENCTWVGFNNGLQAGGSAAEAASELTFINCNFNACTNGFIGTATGNTLNIWFNGCGFVGNSNAGANLGTAGAVYFWGGSSSGNGVATIAPFGGWQGTLRVEGFRFELTPPELAIGTSAGPLVVENCLFTTTSTVPSYPVIGPSPWTIIRGCNFGAFNVTGWLPYEPGQNAAASSLEMVGNSIGGAVPFYINPANGGSNGLRYSLVGNFYNGVIHGSEVGRVVWPNLVNDVIVGSATFASSATVAVTFSARENATYRVALAGNANQTFWVSNKSTTGFTLNSSNPASTASVDWSVSR